MPCYYTNAARTQVYKTEKVDVTNDKVAWTANGYRLPTEAEWEKAARGGLTGKRFPWGDTISHSQASYRSSISRSQFAYETGGVHPRFSLNSSSVGRFTPNGYGLYDMTGNLSEWCWDRFDVRYYKSGVNNDPRGSTSGSYRLHRGGSWGSNASECRVAKRDWYVPSSSYSHVGFRSARGR